MSNFTFGQRARYKKKFSTQKNAMYFYWGYNRAVFSRSTIQFVGPEYDFKVIKAAARDRPSNDIKTYFNPASLTVPQFNGRIGWYYTERWDISFGVDHMKYVMRDYQSLYINGYINGTTNSTLSGTYTNADGKILIREKELHYENTNGLNYISFQLNNTAPLYQTRDRKITLQRKLGIGFGAIMTQTDFNWDYEIYHTSQKIGGYGLSLHGGARLDLFNRFFIQNKFSTGFVHLPNNPTRLDKSYYASQKFVFGQWEILGGFFWYLPHKNGCDSCPDWH